MIQLFARLRSFMRGFSRPTALDADMDAEMRFHIAMEAERLMRQQHLDPVEARRRAAVAFGGIEKYKGAGRDERGITWALWTSADFKLGVRMLVKYPGLTVIGVIALAVAIGGGATYLEFINDLFRPTLRGDHARIVGIQNHDPAAGAADYRALYDFAIWEREVQSLELLGAFTRLERNLVTADGRAEPVRGVEISASAFRLIPTPPLLGRPLLPDDERASAPPVLLIGYDLWQSRFGGDTGIVGRTVTLGSDVHTVVGVMPEGFGFPVNHSLWVPLRTSGIHLTRGEGPEVRVYGRLRQDATLESAQAELTAIAERLATADTTDRQFRVQVKPYVEALISPGGDATMQRLLLYAFNLFFVALLGVCGANVATLVFARTATREAEITVRTALGASRGRIVAQLFAEALVLSLAAAVIGLLGAANGLDWVLGVTERAIQQPAPFWVNAGLSTETVVYALALAVLAAAIVGIVPAIKATDSRMQTRLTRAGASGSGMTFGGVWTGVIVGQVALTVIFLMTVISVGYSTVAGRAPVVSFAFPPHEYISARIERDPATPRDTATEFRAQVRARLNLFERRISSEPGIAGITYTSALPGKKHGEFFVELDGVQPASTANPLWVQTASVGHDYFHTFGVPIVSGRDFASSDIDFERPVAIVDRTFVQQVMGGRDPVGMRIREPQNTERAAAGPWLEIIGVVENLTRTAAPTSEDAVLYRPLAPGTGSAFAVIHARRDAGSFAARLRNVAAEVDPTVRLYDAHTLDARNEVDAVLYEFMLWALGLIGAVALLLSVAGVYSLISFTLARRTTEIGIRAALGAAPARIVAAIFSRAFMQVGLGLFAGSIPGAAIVAYGGGEATRGMGPALGAACALAIAVFIIAVTAFACLAPTRRALRIEPTTALRAER